LLLVLVCSADRRNGQRYSPAAAPETRSGGGTRKPAQNCGRWQCKTPFHSTSGFTRSVVRLQNGKALPSDLPEAPKPNDVEKLPASLRKMLALKVMASTSGCGYYPARCEDPAFQQLLDPSPARIPTTAIRNSPHRRTARPRKQERVQLPPNLGVRLTPGVPT
jgi:hypothetical protein